MVVEATALVGVADGTEGLDWAVLVVVDKTFSVAPLCRVGVEWGMKEPDPITSSASTNPRAAPTKNPLPFSPALIWKPHSLRGYLVLTSRTASSSTA